MALLVLFPVLMLFTLAFVAILITSEDSHYIPEATAPVEATEIEYQAAA